MFRVKLLCNFNCVGFIYFHFTHVDRSELLSMQTDNSKCVPEIGS
jgi:hypothetical protein